MTKADTDTAETEREWSEGFAHFFELDKSDVSICGSKKWDGGPIREHPINPKCPICEALVAVNGLKVILPK